MMTYRINDTTTMAVVDFGDEDDFSAVELTVIFMRDGKDVPVSAVVPSIQAIDVQEDPFMDGYNLTVTYRDGNVTSKFCPKRHTVFNYLSKLVYRALEAEAATEESDPGIYLEPTAGAKEFLVCHSGLSCSTKSPSLSYTWPEHASPFELSHVLSRVYIAMDSDTHIGYINAIDKLYTYYAAHGNQEAFDRMTLDILRDYYPNGEDDIIDERDEINVDRMRELERRYQTTEAATEPAEAAPAPPMTDDTTTATDAAEPSPEPIELTAEEAPAVQMTDATDAAQVDPEAAQPATNRRIIKQILSASKDVVKRHDKYEKLKREGVSDLAEMERGDILTLGASLQLAAFSCIPLNTWYTINNQAVDVTGEHRTPRYYAYIASEYVKYITASKEPAQTTTEPAQAASSPPVDNDTTQPTGDAQAAPEAAGEPCLYMENCFTSFIINSAGERIQIPDLSSAMAWAAEHADASFGAINVAVWRFTHKDNLGNFEKRCIVVDWNGQNEWFFQLDDNFFEKCWAGMLAMGHTLHPMDKEHRAVPAIENAVDFVDVTDYYFPAVSHTPSTDILENAREAAHLLECAHDDHQRMKMWAVRMPNNGNTEAIDEVQAKIEKFRRKCDDAISQAVQLIDPSIADPAQVRQTFKDTDDVAQACMSVRGILNGYICNAWCNDEEAIRRMRECGEAAMIRHMKEVSAAHEKNS